MRSRGCCASRSRSPSRGARTPASTPPDRSRRPTCPPTWTRGGQYGGWPGCCPPTSGSRRSRPSPWSSTPGSPRCAGTTATGSRRPRGVPRRCAPATRWPGRTRSTSTPWPPHRWVCSASTTSPPSASGGTGPPPCARCSAWSGAAGPTGSSRPRCPPTRSATPWSAAWSARCSTWAGGAARLTGPRDCSDATSVWRMWRWPLRTG
jgi:hypothetical protein